MAHKITLWNFSNQLDLSQYLVSITRIDFKTEPDGFRFREYWKDRDGLLEFYEKQRQLLEQKGLQKKTPAQIPITDYSHKFTKVYIGKRGSRKLFRFYVSNTRNLVRAELELLKDGVKKTDNRGVEDLNKISPCFIRKDLYGFNKQIILNFFESFQVFVTTSFSYPLVEWYKTAVKPAKDLLFSKNFLLIRGNLVNASTENSLVVKKPTIKTLARSIKAGLHILLFEAMKRRIEDQLIKEDKQGNFSLNHKVAKKLTHQILILVFITKVLREKWKRELTPSQFEYRINRTAWNSFEIKNEVYKNAQDYYIHFDFRDLVNFLNLAYRKENRDYIEQLLVDLFKVPVPFIINDVSYVQHLIHFLEIHRK